ncbi:MAG: multidrug efflux MFS transporter [Candidatus Kapaibacteriales bacterium]
MRFTTIFAFDEIWKKNLAVLSLAQFIAILGMMAAVPFLPNYVRELGVEGDANVKTWSGLVFAGVYFSGLIMIPMWGSLGDKFGRKNMAVRAIFGLAISVALMAFAQNITQLFLLRILQGALSGFIPASLAFVSANTPNEKSGFAIGILQSANAAGNVLGPFLGGQFADAYGVRNVFLIIGGLCFIAGILVTFFIQEDTSVLDTKKGLRVLKNLRYVWERSDLRVIFIAIILTQTAIQITVPIFPFFVESKGAAADHLAGTTGNLFAIIALFSIMLSPVFGKLNDKHKWYKILVFTAPSAAAAIGLHIFAPDYYYLYPLRAMLGIALPGLIPCFYAALSKRSPGNIKSGIMGIASSGTLIGSLIAFTSSGYIAAYYGMDMVFIVSALFFTIVGVIAFWKIKYGNDKAEMGIENI